MPDIFISQSKKPSGEEHKPEISPVEKEKKEILGKTSYRKKTKDFLASYIRNPQKYDFEIKHKEEKIELLLRMHPITNLKWILIAILMIFAPLTLSQFPILDFLPSNFKFISILGWYMVTTAYILESFLNWYFNVYIITDERIIDVDFYSLIYKEVTDANIDKIQDVTYKMGGVLRTLLNYGDIFIQTASQEAKFEFHAVPKPDKVAKILQDLRIQEQQEVIEGRVM